jgi:hypothetical protein
MRTRRTWQQANVELFAQPHNRAFARPTPRSLREAGWGRGSALVNAPQFFFPSPRRVAWLLAALAALLLVTGLLDMPR